MIRRLFLFLMVVTAVTTVYAQSSVTEISWNTNSGHYSGLLVLYSNNKGKFKVKCSIPGRGATWVTQDAVLTNEYDGWGNCISYINCYNPRSNAQVRYYADNFIVYPNGAMFTQDASGAWSTQISARAIPQNQWAGKMRAYNYTTNTTRKPNNKQTTRPKAQTNRRGGYTGGSDNGGYSGGYNNGGYSGGYNNGGSKQTRIKCGICYGSGHRPLGNSKNLHGMAAIGVTYCDGTGHSGESCTYVACKVCNQNHCARLHHVTCDNCNGNGWKDI